MPGPLHFDSDFITPPRRMTRRAPASLRSTGRDLSREAGKRVQVDVLASAETAR
jgi:hypothetical protein